MQETLGLALAPSEEEKSHTKGAQEILESVNRLESLLTDSKSKFERTDAAVTALRE